MFSSTTFFSPLGELLLISSDSALVAAFFTDTPHPKWTPNMHTNRANHPILAQTITELEEYFAGTRQHFTVPYQPSGTEFQTRAWQSLLQIPFGSTRSYLDQATSINKPKAVRAIGKANGANPLIIIVPCHRVVGKNGTMTGYGGKVWRKEWLLNHEASLLAKH